MDACWKWLSFPVNLIQEPLLLCTGISLSGLGLWAVTFFTGGFCREPEEDSISVSDEPTESEEESEDEEEVIVSDQAPLNPAQLVGSLMEAMQRQLGTQNASLSVLTNNVLPSSLVHEAPQMLTSELANANPGGQLSGSGALSHVRFSDVVHMLREVLESDNLDEEVE